MAPSTRSSTRTTRSTTTTRSSTKRRAPSPTPSVSSTTSSASSAPLPKRRTLRKSFSAPCVDAVELDGKPKGKENIPPVEEARAVRGRRTGGRMMSPPRTDGAEEEDERERAKRALQDEDDLLTTPTKKPYTLSIPTPPATPSLARTVSSPALTPSIPAPSNIYASARALLRPSSTSPILVGREAELRTIATFLSSSDGPGSLYISGPPGGGKTASVRRAVVGWEGKKAWVNCMSLVAPEAVWGEVAGQLGVEGKARRGRKTEGREGVEQALKEGKEDVLIVLDEIDSLLSSASTLLALFSLPRTKLIGIANALDLTARSLPTLPSSHAPQTLHLPAYMPTQLSAILRARLGDYAPLIQPPALELLARRVAAATGDLRTACSVLVAALEAVEKEQRRKASLSDADASPSLAPAEILAHLDAASAPKVGMPHVLRALSARCKSTASAASPAAKGAGAAATIKSLNLHSRLALLTLILALRRASANLAPITPASSSLTPSALYASYAHLLSTHSTLVPQPKSDFIDLLSLLSSASLVALLPATPSRRGRELPVRLEAGEEVVVKGLGLGGKEGGVAEESLREVWEGEERRMRRERERRERPTPGDECPREELLC